MSLDVYVMPIWRFKAGQFTSPLQRLGLTTATLGPGGIVKRAGAGRLRRWKAKRATKQLRTAVGQQLGRDVVWDDDGDQAYGEQSHGFEQLRALVKWLDYRDLLPTFDRPPDDNYYRHPVMSGKMSRPPTYTQVVKHSCFSGYFLPVEFDDVVYVEPYTVPVIDITFRRSVGSSPALRAELRTLSLIVPNLPLDEAERPYIMWALEQLTTVAELSCNLRLPVIFHG